MVELKTEIGVRIRYFWRKPSEKALSFSLRSRVNEVALRHKHVIIRGNR